MLGRIGAIFAVTILLTELNPSAYGNKYKTLSSSGFRCHQHIEGVQSSKTPGDNGFRLKISGNPDKYVPGEVYTVTMQGWRTQYTVQKFIGFVLSAEPGDASTDASPDTVGTFQLFGDALTRFSDFCPNAVTQTSSVPKTEIQVLWTAPGSGNGCIKFRATVVEARDVWYAEDGGLTKELCEERRENQDEQPEIVEPCCACDEAKYEVTFEGLWSRHTHPKDFPTNEWLIHFSDIIGASHSSDYRVWEYGGIASDGLRQVAEWGSTRQMESELKSESEHIRTIIKSRGLWPPNVNGKTFAVFRVDKKHHLMSLVSMFGPSPDWVVGVSALELCLRNCSWVDSRVLNLYPWDAGTDSGITYMSPNAATTPREKIRRITTSNPSDPRSPFYDPSGTPMKPLARLTVTRQRLYEKSCTDTGLLSEDAIDHPDTSEDAKRPECAVTDWGQFSPCSVTCGKGLRMRQRFYVNQMKAEMMGCDRQLVEKEMCAADLDTCEGDEENDTLMAKDEFCQVTEWSQWSSCSVTCGKGFRSRTRRFLHRMGRKKCHLELMEKEMCVGMKPECDEPEEAVDPRCAVTSWSDWSPCSVTCDKGFKVRTRLPLVPNENGGIGSLPSSCQVETMQKAACMADIPDCSVQDMAEAKEICMQEPEVGPCRGYFPRWHFDLNKGMCVQFTYGGCRGNRNNFQEMEDCKATCGFLMTNRKLVPVVSAILRYTLPEPRDGPRYDFCPGSPEPPLPTSSTTSKAKISNGDAIQLPNVQRDVEVDRNNNERGQGRHRAQSGNGPAVDCMFSEWSDWGACSVTCGKGWKEKSRMIKVPNQNGGRPCRGKLTKKKRCSRTPCHRGRNNERENRNEQQE